MTHKNKRKGMMALALLFSLVLLVPAFSTRIHAIDLTQPMSLTLAPGGDEIAEDLAGAGVVYDLYLIATATEDPTYDTFDLNVMDPYTDSITIETEMDNEKWTAAAQTAAGIALSQGSPVVTGSPCDETISNLTAGLYLVVARGEDLGEDYIGSVVDPSLNEDGNIVTIANSDTYEYQFAPQLVMVPTKSDADENGLITTAASDGEWIYDVTGTLKPSRAERFGSLIIDKKLTNYVDGAPAMFVFNIEAKKGDTVVFSDVATLTFTSGGYQQVQVDKIPVNAVVTVTETYTGTVYMQVSDDPEPVTISAAEPSEVYFENSTRPDFGIPPRGDTGIDNGFTYDEENGWSWSGDQEVAK